MNCIELSSPEPVVIISSPVKRSFDLELSPGDEDSVCDSLPLQDWKKKKDLLLADIASFKMEWGIYI
jgi:hypothetical protein